MSDSRLTVAHSVADVFSYRSVTETSDDARLFADLGPTGAVGVTPTEGDRIVLEGEPKLSEIKVSSIAVNGAGAVHIEHKGKSDHEAADPHRAPEAVKAAKAAGLEPIGSPRRRPKHCEMLVRRDGPLVDCHVAFDGAIRQEKAIHDTDGKWSSERLAAA